MCTTLDIDDDVLLAAKVHAAREQHVLGAVISGLAREARAVRKCTARPQPLPP